MYNYYSSEADRFRKQISKLNKLHVLSLILLGALIFPVFSFFQNVSPAPRGEYHYSMFLRNNFTLPVKFIFIMLGFAAGYYYTSVHPFLVGISLFFIFPLVIMIEGTVYKGSHNLLPFEMIMVFIFSLPSIIAAYLGRFIYHKRARKSSTQ